MIINSQPQKELRTRLPGKVLFSKAVPPDVLGTQTVSVSSLHPLQLPAHSRYSAGFTWPVPEVSLQRGPRWAVATAAEGTRATCCSLLSPGQGSSTRVRNGSAIARVPCQVVSSSPHTLTPSPGFIFPAKSPDRTWPGTSLSEAATLRQACR